MDIKALRQRKAELIAAMRDLAAKAAGENRDLTEDEEKQWDAHKADLERTNRAIDRAETLLDEERSMAAAGPASVHAAAGPLRPARRPADGPPPDNGYETAGESLEVGEDRRAQRPFRSLGEQLVAIRDAALGRGLDQRLQMVAAAAGAGEFVDADGGFLVQQDFAAAILDLMHDQGQVFNRVFRVGISGPSNGLTIPYAKETSRATGSRWGGVRGYWVDEGTAATATNPKLGKLELKLKKVAALGYATDELLQDSAAISTLFTSDFADELTFLVEDAIIEGSGVGKPLGIVGHGGTVSVAKETGQAAATIVPENIVKMWSRLHARARFNAVWFINQDIEPQLHLMSHTVGTGGVPVYMPAGGLSASPFASLYGRSVVPIEYCSTLGTVGDIILADLRQYILIDKGGVQQAQSMHVRFTTDEMAFRATYRVDGQPRNPDVLTPFKGSNTLSAFVTLATRA